MLFCSYEKLIHLEGVNIVTLMSCPAPETEKSGMGITLFESITD